MTPLNIIFTWFETGDFPTQDQFQATFSSFFHKAETIPYTSVEGLDAKFNLMLPKSVFDTHVSDSSSHAGYLALLDATNLTATHVNQWKSKLGISYVATVDGTGEPGNVYTKIQVDEFINYLKNADVDINAAIDYIHELLLSNDVDLDQLQEIVDFIKQNKADIEALQAIQVGVTTDDKVNLIDDYPDFGDPETQQDFNRSVYHAVNSIIQTETDMVAVITTSVSIPHNLGTDKLIVQVRDSVTGKSMLCEDYATSTHVQINFLDDVANPCNVLIKKVNA